MGEVQLRPVRLEDLDVFDRSFASVEGAGEHQWFGFTPSHAVRQVFHERGLLGGPHNMASVTVDGELAGRDEWLQRRGDRRDTSACWESPPACCPGTGARATAAPRSATLSPIFSRTPGSSASRPPRIRRT